MRIKIEKDTVSKEVFDSETGQSINLSHTSTEETRYYNIRKLNIKVCLMDIGNAQANICKSSKDIEIFWKLMDSLNKYNELRIPIAKFAKNNNISRSRVTSLISRAIDNNLLKRKERGVYSANPYMIKSKGSTNEIIEHAQQEWKVKST